MKSLTATIQEEPLFGADVWDSIKGYKLPQTQYLGSKERLVEWIYENSPKNITSFFDAFSGTSVVGFYFKTKNKKIISNDFLKFNYHIAKALIENRKFRLDDNDISLLLDRAGGADSFIEDTFTDVFFETDQARFLDQFRANVELLDNEYKKSLAFAVMDRALTRKVLLGHFAHLSALRYSRDPERIRRNPSIARSLRDLFLELVPDYNEAVFDNGQDNIAYCENTVDLVKNLGNVDLAYFDPPYCGCHPDYQAFYHFLETYVRYWKDKKFVNDTRMYSPKLESGFVQKSEIQNSFVDLFRNSAHIPFWLISYNSRSYPVKEDMLSIIEQFKKVKVFEYEYQNHYGGKGSRKGTREYLFYCYE
jgi:adenine-specific DNA-methyltransferase